MNYSIVDIELTEEKEIIEIAIIKTDKQFNIISKHDYLLKSTSPISKFMENLTGINQEMLKNKPYFKELAEEIYEILSDDVLICHGVNQDYSSLSEAFLTCGIDYNPRALIDTVELSKIFFPTFRSYKLSDICKSLGINLEGKFHRATVDTEATHKLLDHIIKSMNNVSENNYDYLITLMQDFSDVYTWFLKLYREENKGLSNNLFKAYGLNFAECILESIDYQGKKKLYLSAISEQRFIDLYLENNNEVAILKDKYSYLVLNLFNIAGKMIDKNKKLKSFLLMRLLVWVEYTKVGCFDELNLDATEKSLIRSIYDSKISDLDNYYYRKNLEYGSRKKYLVSNYSSALTLLSEEKISNHDVVVENKDILYQEIKRQYIKTYHYKYIITELNKTINKNYSKKLILIKESIENLVLYLYEIYVDNSGNLYEEALEFLLQDIEYIKELLETNNIRLLETEKFINLLKVILLDKDKGYYSFEHKEMSNSMYIKFNDVKNQKRVVNQFYSRNVFYLKRPVKINVGRADYTRSEFKVLEKNTLYLFDSDKDKELSYLERDKKANIKFKQYNLDTAFSDIYEDVIKNTTISVCYANKEILSYSIYLPNIFEEIVNLKSKKI